MQVHIDKAGRLVLPKAIRDQLGITPDAALELVLGPEGVLLRRVSDAATMHQVNGLWVHQGAAPASTDWSCILDSVREERDNSAWNA